MISMVGDLMTRDPLALIAHDEVIDQLPNRRIYVGGRDGSKLKNIIIFEMDESAAATRMITAKEGDITRDPHKSGFQLRLRQTRFEERDKATPTDVAKIRPGMVVNEGTYFLAAEKLFQTARRAKPLRAYTLPELTRHIANGAAGEPLKARVEFHRRFSIALACVAFAMVSVPLGITAHRKETSIGFGISLVTAFTYFFFVMLAQTFESTPQAHPVLLMWFPNCLFAVIGVMLFMRLLQR
jgi:lipopolysaccharide export system permease protein